MSERCQSEWFAGLTCGHLYANCPNRQRAETQLRWCGWWDVGTHWSDISGLIDVHGTDVCGLCLHRHNRSHHRSAA